MIMRDLDYVVRYWNKGAERLFGWTAEEAIGRFMIELLQIDRRDLLVAEHTVMAAFADPFPLQGKDYFSPPSIGVALLDASEIHANVHDLMRRADLAMYQAKAQGRNTLRFYDPELELSFALKLRVESELRSAVNNNESWPICVSCRFTSSRSIAPSCKTRSRMSTTP